VPPLSRLFNKKSSLNNKLQQLAQPLPYWFIKRGDLTMADDKVKDRKDEDEDDKAVSSKKTFPKKMIMMIIGFVVVLILAVGGTAAFFMSRNTSDSSSKQNNSKAVKKDKKETANDNADGTSAADNSGDAGNDGANKAIFYSIKPVFVVNIQDGTKTKFLQVQVDIMTHSDKVKIAIDNNLPLIKNDLVALFSSKSYDDLNQPAGKEQLRQDAQKAVQKIIEGQAEGGTVEAVLFPSFVMQ